MSETTPNKIRIKLKTYDGQLLSTSCSSIITAIHKTEAQIIGPISIPTKRKIYCVLRSPHIDKDSREHFEIKIHTKIIDVYRPSSQTIDTLMKLNIPAGIDIEVKL
uniref:Small ribosomal subunit protein uS10c n=1 Tax=Ophidocladus simpliciusculus TaxID=1261574 RepID=A0A1Z1MJJ5_9FLOR|nr:ribosomal protein S10 [Ophidocladus simpliciusculus]ARW66059.1 ribosomal protein S10 [Ophidocladus simpliciusculus]